MNDEFVNEELGFDVENVEIPLVGDQVLDKVEDAPVEVQKSQGLDKAAGGEATVDSFTAEDIFFISDALLNLPTVIWTKLPEREPEKIKTFNKEFHRYCVRKGVNPWDYFFAEFGMVMAVIPILVSYREDYVEFYGKKKDKKETDKLNLDHEHRKEIDEQKEVSKDE